MDVAGFRYDLPAHLIAQEPPAERETSRLMILRRDGARAEHRIFRDFPQYLRAGDLLVLNDTRVIPARLTAVKPSGGRIEALLLERADASPEAGAGGEAARQVWRALVRGFASRGAGARFTFPGGVTVEVIGREEDGAIARVAVSAPGDLAAALRASGAPPTPPYIRRDVEDARLPLDAARYQTVYASQDGAVAAPTAGLHFTLPLLDGIRARGVRVERLTLHVGWGTFRPVRAARVEDHRIDPEPYAIPERLSEAFRDTRARGGRVVAVGTTVTRALEFAVREDGSLAHGSGRCDLFIFPGHRFRAVDALVTNFHLPESSLLMLAAAFAGRERILAAYEEAKALGYRFYSYGDAMLIV